MNICVKLLVVSFLLISGCSSYKGDIDSIDKRCLEAIKSFESNDKQHNEMISNVINRLAKKY